MDMPTNRRNKDPRQIPIQLNVNVPWAFREFLSDKAQEEKTSLNKLVTEALRKEFGREFDEAEKGHAKDQALLMRQETRSVSTS